LIVEKRDSNNVGQQEHQGREELKSIMSLLSSIFGEKQEAAKGSDLFDKSAALPERPQHKPLPPLQRRDTKKRKSEDDDVNDHQDGEQEEPLKDQVLSRKDRKKQKQKQAKVEEEKLLVKEEEKASKTKKKDKDTQSKTADQRMENKKNDKPKQLDKKQEKEGSDSDSESSNDGSNDKSAEEKEEEQNSDKKNAKDSANEPVKEKEQEDDDPEEDNTDQNDSKDAEERTIFVGNLPLATTTRRSLANLFKDCGRIESTRIRSVPVKGIKIPADRKGDQNLVKKVCANTKQYDETLTSTVLGYVVFQTKESVAKALEKNNTTVDKILLKVDTAAPTVDPSRSVFCGNLPYSTDEASLKEHFVKGCSLTPSDVLSARIVRDKETFQCKGFGYVLFKEKDMVSAALKLHNSMYKKKQVRVMVCGKRFKKKKVPTRTINKTTTTAKQAPEKLSAGALRRILAKQQTEAETINKRKRGDKKQQAPAVAGKTKKALPKGSAGMSRRAVAEKKVDKRVKKIQRRISKGMGKKKSR
jgi:nucleolar protein 12